MNSDVADFFFKYLTHLGDGFAYLTVILTMLFFSIRKAMFLLGSFLGSGLIAQFMKHLIFSDSLRPVRFFENLANLHLVEGVTLHGSYSFPSGHTASAFALMFCLAILSPRQLMKALLLILAALIGFSRVYLSQHFLGDVVAGSLIGVLAVIPFYFWFYRGGYAWMDKRLSLTRFLDS